MADRLAAGLAPRRRFPVWPVEANEVFVALPSHLGARLKSEGASYYPMDDGVPVEWRCARARRPSTPFCLIVARTPVMGTRAPQCPSAEEHYLDTWFQCVVRISESLEGQTAEFGPRSPRQKIPFLAPKRCGAEKLRLLSLRAASEACKCEDRNQGWARPSRSNCSDHSAGASRKLATPMPRGSRPSTVAFTRAGAMKAIDIVMLT